MSHPQNGIQLLFFSFECVCGRTQLASSNAFYLCDHNSPASKLKMIAATHHEIVDAPTPIDVMCSTGHEKHHSGNDLFRRIVSEFVHDYARAASSKKTKMQITKIILDLLTEAGVRFLKKCPTQQYWYVGGPKVGRDKIGHFLRIHTRGLSGSNANSSKTTKKPSVVIVSPAIPEVKLDLARSLPSFPSKQQTTSRKTRQARVYPSAETSSSHRLSHPNGDDCVISSIQNGRISSVDQHFSPTCRGTPSLPQAKNNQILFSMLPSFAGSDDGILMKSECCDPIEIADSIIPKAVESNQSMLTGCKHTQDTPEFPLDDLWNPQEGKHDLLKSKERPPPLEEREMQRTPISSSESTGWSRSSWSWRHNITTNCVDIHSTAVPADLIAIDLFDDCDLAFLEFD